MAQMAGECHATTDNDKTRSSK